jgi:hypothetical protein
LNIENRECIKDSIVNLFEDFYVKSYRTLFTIKNEKDIDNFWLFMNNFLENKDGNVFPFISSLYFFFDFYKNNGFNQNNVFQFIIEESEENFYWTTFSEYMLFTVKKRELFFSEFDFKISEDRLTFKLHKEIETPITVSAYIEESKDHKKIYTFLSKDEILSLQETSETLSLQLMEIENAYQFNREMVENIVEALKGFNKILYHYDEVIFLSDSLEDLAIFLYANIEDVSEFEIEDIELFENLFSNINDWLVLSFFRGIEDISNYNEIIQKNIYSITKRTGEILMDRESL